MAGITVGYEECTFSEVVLAIEKSPVAATLFNEWKKFARVLETSQVTIDNLAQDLNLSKKDKIDVIEAILVDWACRTGSTATLGAILSLVEKHFKLESLNDLFREKIKSKAKMWDDLDEQSKEEIWKCPLQFLGRTRNLLELRSILDIPKTIEILQKFLNKELLKSMLGGTVIKLDNIQEEEKLPYYIPRTLLMQRQLNPKIFQEKCTDVFVVEGIQQSLLSRLANPEKTDLSRNQVDEITCRFIILDCPNDYEILRKKSTFPVHRIQNVNGDFFWISTTRSVGLIRKHLMGNPEKITEHEMVTKTLSIHNSRSIAVADCPGMGKTTLLSEVARQVAEHYPERYVLTISLPNMFSSMDKDLDQMSNLIFLKRRLANSCSNSLLGQEILYELMNCKDANFELFLDAFDEIPTSQTQHAEKMLDVLQHSDNLRAFITTRTYKRDHLEHTIGVVSWDIKPFSTKDQIKFFVRFWTNEFKLNNYSITLDNTTQLNRVEEFARDLVKHLQSHEIFSDENDAKYFVGIPIKCFVLAELYSMDAQRHVTSISTNPGITYNFRTLCGIYQQLLALRLEKIPDTQKDAVKEALWLAAIQLLFPTFVDNLKELLTKPLHSSIDTKLLLSVGIVQSLNPPKFIHRTLAEFLVADLITSNMLKEQSENCGTKFFEFLFDCVFASLTSCSGFPLSDYTVNAMIDDFASVLESSTIWPQIDEEFENLAGILGAEKHYRVNRFGMDRNTYLKSLLRWGTVENCNSAPYQKLIKLLRRKTQWPPDVLEKLENVPSAREVGYQHPTIVYFIDTIFNSQVKKMDVDNVDLQIRPYLQHICQTITSPPNIDAWFFENVARCVTRGHLGVLKILFGICFRSGISVEPRSHDWPALVCTSARQPVCFFEALSQFVESLYKKDLSQLDFGRLIYPNEPYTPLHAAVLYGNYPVVEYLVNKYGASMIPASKQLVYKTVFRSVKASPAVVSQRMDIIRRLVDSSKENIIDEPVLIKINEKLVHSAGVTAYHIHVKLFKYLIELGADIDHNFNTDRFVEYVLPSFTPDDVNEMVDFLIEKNLLRLLFRKASEGVCGLEQCIDFDTLRPETLQRIHKCHNFSLEDFAEKSRFLSLVVKSKWQPDMVKSVVEIFNDVDLCDEGSCTLLMHAAYEKSLSNIRYLTTKGANVNHTSASGWSPLSATVYVDEKDSCDPSLIHVCIEDLLAAGADVNVRVDETTVWDELESRNWKLNLQKETIDLLIARANVKNVCNQNGPIQTKECVIV